MPFKEGTAEAVPLEGKSWIWSPNTADYAAFLYVLNPVEDKLYPTLFNGVYEPGQGDGQPRDLSWYASAVGFTGEDVPDHAYWEVYETQSDEHYSFSANGKDTWNVKEHPFTVKNFRASNTKNLNTLSLWTAAYCALKAEELKIEGVPLGAVGFFSPEGTIECDGILSEMTSDDPPTCDKCEGNTFSQKISFVINAQLNPCLAYPEWDKDNANNATETRWDDFAGRVKEHERKHYSDYKEVCDAYISKWGKKEWNARACFGNGQINREKHDDNARLVCSLCRR